MIKYALVLMNMLGLLVYQFFFAGNVSVTQSVPASAKYNTDFTVEVTINKGEVNSFAKLSIDLPEGLVASPVETKGASFTFSNQSAKFIWTSMPGDASFKISYKVKVGAGATNGEKSISGKFAYVVDNVKQTVELASSSIKIMDVVATPVAAAPVKSEPVAQAPSAATTSQPAVAATPVSDPASTSAQTTTASESQPTSTSSTSNAAPATEAPASTAAATTNGAATSYTSTEPAAQTTTQATEPAQTVTTTAATATPSTTTENTVAPATTSAATETAKVAATEVATVGANRVMPAEASGEFKVEITVTKANLSGFAKLQETIPAGLMALPVETMGATFTFVDQVAKFVWVSLPSQSEFKVIYKLVPGVGGAGEKTIEGLFSYIENDETKKSIIVPGKVSVKEAAQQPAVAATVPETNTTEVQSATNPVAETAAKTTGSTSESTTQAAVETAAATPNIPSPQSGVNYRVQIMALHRTIDVGYFATTYKLDDKVMVDSHEGWTKYTVGSFNEYKQGRDHRENVRSKGVVGPFVTAYNQGKRITVQEALMITNQKWYK